MNEQGQQFRVGQGLDVHAFGDGDHVILCGRKIPYTAGVDAHSDGDVALHALCDALLGAAALGDIGHHFPPDDPQYTGADSRELTRSVVALVNSRGWVVNNADLTLVCQAPRIGPHVEVMRSNVAGDLGVDISAVSVKATTTEGLGFCGRNEGIAAMAVVSLVSVSLVSDSPVST
jgi:2-C-methyl-D-erythritol 2,4-cyclodiphosphate synthase